MAPTSFTRTNNRGFFFTALVLTESEFGRTID